MTWMSKTEYMNLTSPLKEGLGDFRCIQGFYSIFITTTVRKYNSIRYNKVNQR